jgi:membrane-bound metal-dependent hydrolase YbcI (DUF457 family)
MVLPGHLAGGYLASKLIVYLFPNALLGGLTTPESTALTIIAILASELPDLDLIRFYFEQKKNGKARIKDHREYFSHAPSFWLFISATIALFGFYLNDEFIKSISVMILVGTWSHLILDSLEHGVMWLWPLSKKKFFLLKTKDAFIDEPLGTFRYYWKFVTQKYFTYFTFYVELLVTGFALWIFLT